MLNFTNKNENEIITIVYIYNYEIIDVAIATAEAGRKRYSFPSIGQILCTDCAVLVQIKIPASSFCWIRLGATKPLLEDKRVAMATGITQQTTTPKTFFMATRTETYIRVSQSLKNRDDIERGRKYTFK